MPRRRRSHPVATHEMESRLETQVYMIPPAVVRKDLLRVAIIYLSLLIILVAIAYWQQRSGVPTQIGHAMRLFLGF